MFASNEAGRAVAKGMAISVVCHTLFAWVVAEYVSAGTVRPIELQARGLSEEVPEITGRFAEPRDGRIGRTIAPSNGTSKQLGRESGDRGAAPEKSGGSSTSEGDSPEAPNGAAGREHKSPDEESEERVEGESPTEPPERDEPEPVTPSETVRETAPQPTEATSATAQADQGDESGEEAAPASDAAGEHKGAKPTFPSITGEGAGGSGDEGAGEGSGTRGGVSIALIEQVIRAHRDEILECYASRHDYVSNGQKSVITEFWIGTEGYPSRVRTVHRTTNGRVADCVTDRIAEWKFPELDETVSFVKKFTFDARIEAKWVEPRLPRERED